MKVQISHFKIDTPRIWGFSEKSLALVEEYRAKGVAVFLDQYPYDRSSTNLGHHPSGMGIGRRRGRHSAAAERSRHSPPHCG